MEKHKLISLWRNKEEYKMRKKSKNPTETSQRTLVQRGRQTSVRGYAEINIILINISSNIKVAVNKIKCQWNICVTLRRNKNFQAGDSQMPFQMLGSQPLHCKETWWIRSEKVTHSKYDAREYSKTKETLWGDTDRIHLSHRNCLPGLE